MKHRASTPLALAAALLAASVAFDAFAQQGPPVGNPGSGNPPTASGGPYGPGDGTGNQGVGPKDGTGRGPGDGTVTPGSGPRDGTGKGRKKGAGSGSCSGSGPNGQGGSGGRGGRGGGGGGGRG